MNVENVNNAQVTMATIIAAVRCQCQQTVFISFSFPSAGFHQVLFIAIQQTVALLDDSKGGNDGIQSICQ